MLWPMPADSRRGRIGIVFAKRPAEIAEIHPAFRRPTPPAGCGKSISATPPPYSGAQEFPVVTVCGRAILWRVPATERSSLRRERRRLQPLIEIAQRPGAERMLALLAAQGALDRREQAEIDV